MNDHLDSGLLMNMGWWIELDLRVRAAGAPVNQVSPRTLHLRGKTLTFAGATRLDNARALAEQWGLPATASDAEIIGHAYCVWGDQFPERLRGDFSFALFDEASQALWLVRDPLGVAPLYYHGNAGLWIASDSLDILLAHPAVPDPLNDPVVAEWCCFGHVYHQTETFFAAIHKVPKATQLRISRDGVVAARRYWSPETIPPLEYAGEDDYVDHLHDLLNTVIGDRLDTTRPMAAHSSGGLDSTPIAIIAGRACRQPGQAFHTYNWCKPEAGDATPCHEWDDARQVAQAEGFHHQEFGMTAAVLKRSLLHHDPARDGTTTFEYETAVLTQARQAGVRTIFSGFGGDEMLTIRARDQHINAIRAGRLREVYRRLALEADPRLTLRPLRLGMRYARLLRQSLWPKPAERQDWFRQHRRRYQAHRALLSPEFAPGQNPDRLDDYYLADTIAEKQRIMLERGYHQERIETWAILGRRAGVRHVYPYLDQRLVEFALAIPAELYFKHGQSRYLYRKALRDILPDFLSGKAKRPESDRVRQLVLARQQALTDPEVLDRIAQADSPYIDTRTLLNQCQEAKRWNPDDWQNAIPTLKALTTAIMTLNINQRR